MQPLAIVETFNIECLQKYSLQLKTDGMTSSGILTLQIRGLDFGGHHN